MFIQDPQRGREEIAGGGDSRTLAADEFFAFVCLK